MGAVSLGSKNNLFCHPERSAAESKDLLITIIRLMIYSRTWKSPVADPCATAKAKATRGRLRPSTDFAQDDNLSLNI